MDITNEIKVSNSNNEPKDTVQDIAWFSNSKMFATGGWDGFLRVYTFQSGGYGGISLAFSVFLDDPVITISLDQSCNIVYAGLADGNVKAVELSSGSVVNLLKLNTAICKAFWISQQGCLLTISFSKSMLFSMFAPQPNQKEVLLEQKAVAADLSYPVLLIGTQAQRICLMDVTQNMKQPYYQLSPLERYSKISMVVLNIKENACGIASLDGRACLVNYDRVKLRLLSTIVTFRAQQEKLFNNVVKLYFTSQVRFHPHKKNKILVAGDDNNITYYDYQHKTEHKKYKFDAPISVARFSPNGEFVAYSLGSVWRNGLNDIGKYQPRLMVHKIETTDTITL